MPRLVYHGTDAETAKLIARQGILPRFQTKRSNWKIASHEDHVYLTRFYAGYFGLAAAALRDVEAIGIVEVDLDRLSPENLYPDEDYVEQALRALGMVDEDIAGDEYLQARTLAIRNRIDDYQEAWEASLEDLGSVAHRGPIPVSTITRISIYDPKSNPALTLRLSDPTITVLNATIYGRVYQLLTAWLMGDPVSVDEFLRAEWPSQMPPPAEVVEAVTEMLNNRNGITSIPVGGET